MLRGFYVDEGSNFYLLLHNLDLASPHFEDFLRQPNYSSMVFSNSFKASNSSLDRVTPLPIFSRSDPHPSSPKSDIETSNNYQAFIVGFGGGVRRTEGGPLSSLSQTSKAHRTS